MIMAKDLDDAALKAVRIANIVKQVRLTSKRPLSALFVLVDILSLFATACRRPRTFRSACHSSCRCNSDEILLSITAISHGWR